jgi:hypothetical protein
MRIAPLLAAIFLLFLSFLSQAATADQLIFAVPRI